MQHFLTITVCVLYATCYLLGCGDPVDTSSRAEIEPVATLNPTAMTGALTAEETFAKLRVVFPNTILDANFKTLRQVTMSQTYLDFIQHAYPIQSPFQSLEEYFQVAPPDAERYTDFLKDWVEAPTPEDVEKWHQVTVAYRCASLIPFRILNLPPQPLKQPKADEPTGIALMLEKRKEVRKAIGLQAWLADNEVDLLPFLIAFEVFVVETEKADAVWLREQFEVRNGVDEGLLWSALLNPALIGEILTNFSRPEIFLKWIENMSEIE